MCQHESHGSDCQCDRSNNWGKAWRAIWITFIVAVPLAAMLYFTSYYQHLVRVASENSESAMINYFGTTSFYFRESVFYMSFTMSIYFSAMLCVLVPFAEWIWKRNNFRSRLCNLEVWRNTTAMTFIAECAIGFFWLYLTLEVGGSGPFFAAILGIVGWAFVYMILWRYDELKVWCGLLIAVALVIIPFLLIQSASNEKAPRPSMGHLLRYAYYM